MFRWISDSLFCKQLVWHLPLKNGAKGRKEGREGRTKSRQQRLTWNRPPADSRLQRLALCPLSVQRGRDDSRGSYPSPTFPLPCSLLPPKAQQAAHGYPQPHSVCVKLNWPSPSQARSSSAALLLFMGPLRLKIIEMSLVLCSPWLPDIIH